LLLYDLCVIDVDTQADADALEARFPELAAAPMATTSRGRHYYFSRSPLADAHGYYDGAAQRTPNVDFKTRAGGGGSGFVVMAPSVNKARRAAGGGGGGGGGGAARALNFLNFLKALTAARALNRIAAKLLPLRRRGCARRGPPFRTARCRPYRTRC
jgi:hypothetical protein